MAGSGFLIDDFLKDCLGVKRGKTTLLGPLLGSKAHATGSLQPRGETFSSDQSCFCFFVGFFTEDTLEP